MLRVILADLERPINLPGGALLLGWQSEAFPRVFDSGLETGHRQGALERGGKGCLEVVEDWRRNALQSAADAT